MVVALYGSPGSRQGNDKCMPIPSHLQIFREDHKPGASTQAPKYSINLETSQVCVVKPMCGRTTERVGQSFCVTTKERNCYEFRACSENECQLWINIIKFLILFPHSCLPQEPDSIKLNFDQALDPKLYRAGLCDHIYIIIAIHKRLLDWEYSYIPIATVGFKLWPY